MTIQNLRMDQDKCGSCRLLCSAEGNCINASALLNTTYRRCIEEDADEIAFG